MVVYHGSNHSFQTMRIRKDLTKQSTLENEGYGIYFSLSRAVAESYGKWLYTIAVNDRFLVDMRSMRNCRVYVMKLRQEMLMMFKIRLEDYIDLRTVARYLNSGGVAICGVATEVKNLLDSSELFYMQNGSRVEAIFAHLNKWTGVPKAYIFPYHIKGCGIIRDLSPTVAGIIDKERL